MNFYEEKSSDLPRLLYRHLFKLVSQDKSVDIVQAASQFVSKTKGPDYLKMVWHVPKFLRKSLSPQQLSDFEAFCAKQNARRPDKIKKHVFPHVSDEFSLSDEFLSEAFDVNALCKVSKDDVIYTIGSCFARNFSKFLSAKGINCKNFGQAEDLNSPGSNQILLQYARAIEEPAAVAAMKSELEQIWSGVDPAVVEQMFKQHVEQLKSLRSNLQQATKVIVTLGNTVDYYQNSPEGLQTLVPKFLAMSPSEDVRVRDSISARLAKLNTFIRLSSFTEVSRYILSIYTHIRAINPNCSIVFTVSPVPIDSVLGLQGTNLRAVEVDCVSKSTIRSALHEVMHTDTQLSKDTKVHYLPSFEIVRWIAPLVGIPVFGMEDAASRHVSNAVLNAVCGFAYRTE